MFTRHVSGARCARLLLPAIGFTFFAAPAASAATCPDFAQVSQPPTSMLGTWEAFLSEWSVLGGPAENFAINDDISAVTWWGFLDNSGGDVNLKQFRLTFFAPEDPGNPSLPGGIAHVYDVSVAPQETGEVYDTETLIEFHATLDPPCPLRRGWLVIEGSDANPVRQFSWISSDTGDGVSAIRAWWGWWYWVSNVDLALCLQPVVCSADVTGDGVVDVMDLMDVIGAWNTVGGVQDVNRDGIVDMLDVLEVLAAWGPCQ